MSDDLENDKAYRHAIEYVDDELPDVRDGLTRKQRIILYCLDQLQKEREGRQVPTAMLYGRVVEYLNISVSELEAALTSLTSSSIDS